MQKELEEIECNEAEGEKEENEDHKFQGPTLPGVQVREDLAGRMTVPSRRSACCGSGDTRLIAFCCYNKNQRKKFRTARVKDISGVQS